MAALVVRSEGTQHPTDLQSTDRQYRFRSALACFIKKRLVTTLKVVNQFFTVVSEVEKSSPL